MLRSGWHSDQVRVLWSAADIAFLTVELKLFEEILTALARTLEVRVETTLLVGYPLLIAASGLWWRVSLVWITTAPGDGGLHLAVCRRGAALASRTISPGIRAPTCNTPISSWRRCS